MVFYQETCNSLLFTCFYFINAKAKYILKYVSVKGYLSFAHNTIN